MTENTENQIHTLKLCLHEISIEPLPVYDYFRTSVYSMYIWSSHTPGTEQKAEDDCSEKVTGEVGDEEGRPHEIQDHQGEISARRAHFRHVQPSHSTCQWR